jgi:predicted permease
MIDRDVREEISFHIEEQVRDLVCQGWTEEAARARILARFGNVESVERACREYDAQRVDGNVRRMAMDGWIRDGRLALRGMARNPAFTAAVVVTLALGIGATTAVFSVVEGFLLRPMPFPEADRLVMVWENDRATGTLREDASTSDYYDFVERARGFEGFALYALNSAVLTGAADEPARLSSAQVTANLADVLGIDMRLGRFISPEEDIPDGPPVVVLSDALWRSAFDGNPDALGRSLNIDDVPHTVVGVLPPEVRFPAGGTDVWLPIRVSRATATRPNHWVEVVARMAPDTELASARAEMTRVMAELEVEYPADNANRGAFVEPLGEVGRGDLRETLWVLFAAVVTVLAIACVNVANLILARSASRSRDLAVHLALGAGAGQIRRRFLVEGLLITGAACAGGLALAVLGVRLLSGLAPVTLTRLGEPGVNGTVLGFTLGVSALIGLGFALLPAVRARGADVQAELKDGRAAGTRTPRVAVRRVLVAAQLALAVVLLVGATLLMSTLRNLQAVDPGFQSTSVLRMAYTLPESRYPRDFANWPNWVEVHAFNRFLIERAEALPGVRSATVVTDHPLSRGFTNSFRIEGREYDPEQGEIATRLITPGYFETVGLALVAGRLPTPSDGPDDPHTIVLNRKAVARYFPDGGALGARIGFWGQFREVIGIVEDELMYGLSEEAPAALYVNLLQSPPIANTITLMVRTEVPPLDLADAVRGTIWSLDGDLAVFNVATMEDTLADASARERFASAVLAVFAGVAIFLAILGVHSLLAYLVAQRGHEVGVRMALGATRSDVVRGVIRQAGGMVGLGTVVGVLGALGVSRFLEGLLYGVSATDPWAYAAAAVGLGLVALAASFLPAWKAASISPVVSLQGQ